MKKIADLWLNFRIASQPLPIKFGGRLTIFLFAFTMALIFVCASPSNYLSQAQAQSTATTPAPTATPQPTPTPVPPTPTPTSESQTAPKNTNGPVTLLIFVGIFIVGSILAVVISTWRIGRRRR